MPIKRKACELCFKGKRRCDFTYPACSRCQKHKKPCNYSSPDRKPQAPGSHALDRVGVANEDLSNEEAAIEPDYELPQMDFETDFNDNLLGEELLNSAMPTLTGSLGDLQPVSGRTESWDWAIEQFKSYPKAFFMNAETVFIHRSTTQDSLPQPLRTAYGVCAAYSCMDEGNKATVFRVLDTEISDLIKPPTDSTLLEDLSRMQAIVLYQIIRLFDGDLKFRVIAEQQHYKLGALALQLLKRAESELQDAPSTWENWILTESIRRTVMMAYGAYALYSTFKYGMCIERPTMSLLPVSVKQNFWTSQKAYLQQFQEDQVVNYVDFTKFWIVSPARKLDPYERLILVSCKGLEAVEALNFPEELSKIS